MSGSKHTGSRIGVKAHLNLIIAAIIAVAICAFLSDFLIAIALTQIIVIALCVAATLKYTKQKKVIRVKAKYTYQTPRNYRRR